MQHVPRVEILGVPISRVTVGDALGIVGRWLDEGSGRYICACDVHSLMRAQSDAGHMRSLVHADLVTPDGQPVVWTARLRGIANIERVCGPDLMPLVCSMFVDKARHYFLGGALAVPEAVARNLRRSAPHMVVVGAESPPFHDWSAEERIAILERIRQSRANILWVGLGCPKQEAWMLANRDQLPGVIMFGVGAAFDFHAERVSRAPVWMRTNGLEWLHRLMSEPRRLWHRYLVLAPQFAFASMRETIALRRRARS